MDTNSNGLKLELTVAETTYIRRHFNKNKHFPKQVISIGDYVLPCMYILLKSTSANSVGLYLPPVCVRTLPLENSLLQRRLHISRTYGSYFARKDRGKIMERDNYLVRILIIASYLT